MSITKPSRKPDQRLTLNIHIYITWIFIWALCFWYFSFPASFGTKLIDFLNDTYINSAINIYMTFIIQSSASYNFLFLCHSVGFKGDFGLLDDKVQIYNNKSVMVWEIELRKEAILWQTHSEKTGSLPKIDFSPSFKYNWCISCTLGDWECKARSDDMFYMHRVYSQSVRSIIIYYLLILFLLWHRKFP